ncbi:hypothetical protein [Lacipirellula parvula]|uniref:Uncharacterized protein n=1 Tax=Lacipirellula parvula TaxID=2650471 RepID=A0A5K7X284_9BACT|nr:hypothetical protein [Lacipirellula parvula]BBO30445.1 hypothetical protein PLANPX_0057 [Lacipirellula parvula]
MLEINSMLILGASVATIWYSLPLIVSVSLVCAATRHELMKPILQHAVRFAAWVVGFMAVFVGLLALLGRLQ